MPEKLTEPKLKAEFVELVKSVKKDILRDSKELEKLDNAARKRRSELFKAQEEKLKPLRKISETESEDEKEDDAISTLAVSLDDLDSAISSIYETDEESAQTLEDRMDDTGLAEKDKADFLWYTDTMM